MSRRSVTIVALRVACVVMVGLAIFFGFRWMQLAITMRDGVRMETSLAALAYGLNEGVREFEGDAVSAAQLSPRVAEGQAYLRELRTDIAQLPGSGVAAEYRSDLVTYVELLEEHHGYLENTAGFVTYRAGWFGELVDALAAIDAGGSDSGATDRLVASLDGAIAATDTAIKRFSTLEETQGSAYTSATLLEYLSSVRQELAALRQAFEDEDSDPALSSAAALVSLFEADWEALFFELHDGRLEMWRAALDEVDRIRDRLTEHRVRMAAQRRVYGFGSLALLVAAGVLGVAVFSRPL